MECAEVQMLLGHAVDGELTDELRAAAERHIFRCPACREEIEGLRTISDWLAAAFAGTPLPAEARDAALSRIANELTLPAGRLPAPGQLVLFTDAGGRRHGLLDAPGPAAGADGEAASGPSQSTGS